jgi:hypothetical protein
VQVCVVYFMTAFYKARGACWIDGTALHYVLHNEQVRRYTLGMEEFPLLINVLTYGALLLESAMPFLLWSRAARPWVIPAGLAMHAGITVTINAPLFGELMVLSYLTFLTPDELGAVGRRLDPRNWFSRQRAAAPMVIPGRVDGPEALLAGPHRPVGVPAGAGGDAARLAG